MAKVSIFSELPPESVRATLQKLAVGRYAKGLAIFNESDAATHIFLILAGNASVNVCDAKGRRWKVHMAGPGDLLGVSAMFSGGPYGVSAVAETGVTVGAMRRDDFSAFLRRFPQAYFRLAECLGKDLAAAYHRLSAPSSRLRKNPLGRA
ncbi:MAG TPA: Crp/Fnr family transcriptional regulator [Terriglobia bacterium]|nr:Crp/Fnr family transcriptional regulator [Terriglobia bacterium]